MKDQELRDEVDRLKTELRGLNILSSGSYPFNYYQRPTLSDEVKELKTEVKELRATFQMLLDFFCLEVQHERTHVAVKAIKKGDDR